MNTGIVKKLALAGAGALLLAVAGCAAPLSEAPAYTVAAYQPGEAIPQADVVTITRAQFDGLGRDGAELLERLALGTVVYIAGGDGDTPAPEDGVQIGTALTAAGDQVQAQQVYALWEEGGALPEDHLADGVDAAMLPAGCAGQLEGTGTEGAAAGGACAVLYDGAGARAGLMGYALYTIPAQGGDGTQCRDVICLSAFQPEGSGRCREMRVALDCPENEGRVIEVEQARSAALTGEAQADGPAVQVTKEFDMTSGRRAWTFRPEDPQPGAGWAQLTGARVQLPASEGRWTMSVCLSLDDGPALCRQEQLA